MARRLHRDGRFRTWLGARLGGDRELGDRALRRIFHGLGAAVLLYYVLPPHLLGRWPNAVLLFAALGGIVLLELLRLGAGLELPTIRPYEQRRPASYAYFAVALVAAIVLFPEPIAAAVVLMTALVDPLLGELRRGVRRPAGVLGVAGAVAFALAFSAFRFVGAWALLPSAGLAALGASLAVLAEWPKWRGIDDDLAMTLVPGAVLYALVYLVPSLV